MDDSDAMAVLDRARSEGIPFNWLRAPHNDVDTASCYQTEHGWRVSTTGERTSEEDIRDYSDRAEAVEDFIGRVGAFIATKELRRKLFGR